MDFRFQNTESGKLMQKLIVEIIVKISGKFTSTAVQLFPALALRGKCEKILLFVFVLFCFFLFCFFTNHDKEKSQTQFMTIVGDHEATHFVRQVLTEMQFFTKTRHILLTKQQPGNDWSMSYFCDLGSHVRCSEKLSI